MKKYILYLLLPLFILSCAEDSGTTSDEGGNLSEELESIELEASYDTTRMACVYMKVMGKESFTQAEYKKGISYEEVTQNPSYESLVNVEVLGSLYADESEEGYVDNENGSIKSKLEVYDMVLLDMEDIEQPFRITVKTRITDFDAWKSSFDEEELNRNNAGMRQLQIGINVEDPQEIFMMLAIEDISKAREMMEHHGLRKKMKESGVLGDPRVKFWRPAGPMMEEL